MSLLGGWLPIVVQVLAAVVLLAVVARRSRRWWLIWIPVCVAVGAAAFGIAWSVNRSEGLSSDPPPQLLWWWVAMTGFAVAAAVVGFLRTRWWRRVLSVVAIVVTALATGIVLNQWVGYFTTVQEAWAQTTAGPLPDQVDASALAGLRGHQQTTGKVVAITTPDSSSHFSHRTEYVYLPPQWFVGSTAARLPVIMMIAGEFNTPADWIRTGNAVRTIDTYAEAHGGAAPILVFPDVGGSFNNDTECVNGSRGNVADHLVTEVRPYVISHFGAADGAAQWGVVGWSMGGTCAVDLAVMHPDLFSAFEDIAGDAAPSSGDKSQTISRLFGGDAAQWDAFDPTTVMKATAAKTPGAYARTTGWFDDSSGGDRGPGHFGGGQWPGQGRPSGRPRPPGQGGPQHRWKSGQSGGTGLGGRDQTHTPPGTELAAAQQLCATGKTVGIRCDVHTQPGTHSWQFAAAAFSDALGWFSQELRV